MKIILWFSPHALFRVSDFVLRISGLSGSGCLEYIETTDGFIIHLIFWGVLTIIQTQIGTFAQCTIPSHRSSPMVVELFKDKRKPRSHLGPGRALPLRRPLRRLTALAAKRFIPSVVFSFNRESYLLDESDPYA